MSLFTSNPYSLTTNLNWKPLQSISELDTIEKKSYGKPVVIFKHSTRCSISRIALKQFEKEYEIDPNKIDSYFLDLLSFRSVSNEIAHKFLVKHESPQILLIKNGKCIYHASHSDIDVEAVSVVLKEIN